MKGFGVIFFYELKKIITRKKIIFLFIISLLSLYIVQSGINKYKNINLREIEFLNIENIKTNQYINYLQYGAYGFRVFFRSSPTISFFLNSNVFSNLKTNIDTRSELHIYSNVKGSEIFKEKSGSFKDFSGIIFVFGSLLSLVFGYRTINNKHNIAFISELMSFKKIYFLKLLARLILLTFFLLFLYSISLILFIINSVHIIDKAYILLHTYFVILLYMNIFYFLFGVFSSTFKSVFSGLSVAFIFWLSLIFIIPGIIDYIISKKAENLMSIHQLELIKLKIIMNFEKETIKKIGITNSDNNNTQTERNIVEDYYKHEFVQLQAFEKKLENEIIKNIKLYQFFSSFFPSTFYLSISNEISSRGYNSYLEFYRYVQGLKRKFLRYYIDRKFYSTLPKFKKVESFVKNEENIFQSKPSLPEYFLLGVILMFSYIVILFIVSYIRFRTILKR